MYTGNLLTFTIEQSAKLSTYFGKTTSALELALLAERIQSLDFHNAALVRSWVAMRLEC